GDIERQQFRGLVDQPELWVRRGDLLARDARREPVQYPLLVVVEANAGAELQLAREVDLILKVGAARLVGFVEVPEGAGLRLISVDGIEDVDGVRHGKRRRRAHDPRPEA